MKVDAPDANLATIARAAVVRKSSKAARRLIAAAREYKKSSLASRGSRNVVYSSGFLYFLILESTWQGDHPY